MYYMARSSKYAQEVLMQQFMPGSRQLLRHLPDRAKLARAALRKQLCIQNNDTYLPRA